LTVSVFVMLGQLAGGKKEGESRGGGGKKRKEREKEALISRFAPKTCSGRKGGEKVRGGRKRGERGLLSSFAPLRHFSRKGGGLRKKKKRRAGRIVMPLNPFTFLSLEGGRKRQSPEGKKRGRKKNKICRNLSPAEKRETTGRKREGRSAHESLSSLRR